MAYDFNGTNQSLSAADNAILDITGALTLHCVFKSDLTTADKGVFSKRTSVSNQRSYMIGIFSSKAYGEVSSNGAFPSPSSSGFLSSATNHGTGVRATTFVFTPSTSLELFFDGISDAIATSGVIGSVFSSTTELRIGTYDGVLYLFDGQISECAIWSAALTSDEVNGLGKGFKPTRIRPQSLVFYAPLIRNLQDVKAGLALTNNNSATVAAHPRVY